LKHGFLIAEPIVNFLELVHQTILPCCQSCVPTYLLVQALCIAYPGLGGVLLQVASIARRPAGLIGSSVKAAKRRLSGIAVLVLTMLGSVEFVMVRGMGLRTLWDDDPKTVRGLAAHDQDIPRDAASEGASAMNNGRATPLITSACYVRLVTRLRNC